MSTGGDTSSETVDSSEATPSVAVFHAADGSLVAEVNPPIDNDALLRLVTTARTRGIEAIWVSGRRFSGAPLGFKRRRGYARLQSTCVPVEVDTARPPLSVVPELQTACRSGVWGHHRPATEADPDATFVGLYESGEWIGICEVDLERNQIDSPGLRAPFRTADRYARLVREASSLLTAGRMTLETWGDTEAVLDTYRALGFVLVEYVPGWELAI